MSHLCSVCIRLVCDYTYFSPPSPHREGESDCDSYITNTFKEMGSSVFLLNLQTVRFCLAGRNLSHLLRRFHIWPCAHWSSLLSLCLSPTQECSDSGWQVKAGGSEGRPDGCTQTQTTQLEMLPLFFFFVSLSLSLASSLPSFLFLYVSPSMPCFSAALLFVCGKTKKEKMLRFLFVFLFFCFFLFSVGFFVFMHLICHVAIHSRSLCLSSSLSSLCLFSPVLWILW